MISIIDIDGDGFEAGVRYGEAVRGLIHTHLDYAIESNRRQAQLEKAEIYRRAYMFRDIVSSEFPEIGAEIDGIAKGAGIDVQAAWALQLRADIAKIDPANVPAECTSFGATGPATVSGTTIAGQNGDLPAFYKDILVLIRRNRTHGPSYLTLTPAGQLAWHGINANGVAIFANFLCSEGWRPGIPRYLFSRIAMDHATAQEAVDHLTRIRRGSSRNVLIADENTVVDVELAVERAGRIEAKNGLIAHANHHLSEIADLETASKRYMRNSCARQQRIDELLAHVHGRIDVPAAAAVLRDRESFPDTISRVTADDPEAGDGMTVASTIADVTNRTLWITLGPPHLAEHRPYRL